MTRRATFNTFWHGGELSPLGRACLTSFVRRGHDVRLFAYDAVRLPTGVVLADARDVITQDDPLYRACAAQNVTAFADCFRYELLLAFGGWWVDTDVYCLTDAAPDAEHAWAEQEPGVINNAILRFPKGDPLCARLAERAREAAGPSTKWGATGPDLITDVMKSVAAPDAAGTRATFYPIHWIEAHMLWMPEHKDRVVRRVSGADFLHCWAKALSDMGIDMHRRAPAGSYLAAMLGEQSGVPPLGLWRRLQTHQRISRFQNQAWVRDYWTGSDGSGRA